MRKPRSDVAFSDAVKTAQERLGSRAKFALAERNEEDDFGDVIEEALAEFIAARDTFFLATASAAGQPYVQHRGGPQGFLRVLDEKTLAFADFSGNRQYITLGNLAENPKALIFLLDYENRRRVKIWGEAQAVESDAALITSLTPADYKAKIERAIVFRVTAWNANCPSHIQRRFTEADVLAATDGMRRRIEELETEVARLRGSSA
jgi:predicted pyridoxine 5'-phosphate oxidase superfamily flavin-nucleotide-binding protein